MVDDTRARVYGTLAHEPKVIAPRRGHARNGPAGAAFEGKMNDR
jgi:hypothetical protein